MKRWELHASLQSCLPFSKPDISLEQYSTGAELAADTLFAIHGTFDDIEGKLIADIGCGTGILGIGCALLGAAHVVGFDVDTDAIDQAMKNSTASGLSSVDWVHCDVLAPTGLPVYRRSASSTCDGPFDMAITNPPFGTRRPGADVGFVAAGLRAVHSEGTVYSMHKSSTRAHLVRTAEALGVGVEVVAQLRFDLPASYEFHKAGSLDVAVDLLRFAKGDAGRALAARHNSIPPFTEFGGGERGGGGGGGGRRGGKGAKRGGHERGARR